MKRSLCLCYLLATFFTLTACGVKEPTEKTLSDIIPSEVLSYEYNGIDYTSRISSLEIVRAKLDDSIYTADCICKLKDDISDRTVYITLELQYWDKGGWQLDSWTPYEEEDIVFNISFDENILSDNFQSLGYNFENFSQIQFIPQDDKHVYAAYSLQDKHENLIAVGEVYANGTLVSEEGYPKKYYWRIDVDESMVSCIWNIHGTWSATSLPPFYEKRGVEFTVKNMSEEGFWTDLRIPFYEVAATINSYNTSGSPYEQWESESLIANYYDSNGPLSERHLILEIPTGAYNNYHASFYSDSAYCAIIIGKYMGTQKENGGWVNLDKIG